MDAKRKYALRGRQLWIGDRLVELDRPIVELVTTRDQIAELGLPPMKLTGTPLSAMIDTTETSYDIGLEGAVVQITPRAFWFLPELAPTTDIPITIEGQVLTVGDKVVPITGHFKRINLLRDMVVVTRDRDDPRDIRNVFGVDATGRLAWVIEAPAPFERALVPIGYWGVAIRNGRVTAIDDFGRIFALDLTNGRIGEQLGREMDR